MLRRPPRPPLPPSAHDMLRESAIVSRLHAAGARVPGVLAVCATSRSACRSTSWSCRRACRSTPRCRRRSTRLDHAPAGAELIDALAELHAIDPEAAGLATFGRPEGYLERQVGVPEDLAAQRHARPARGRGARRVAARAPAAAVPATVVHGDYRVGNLLVAEDPPRISAVLDWELSTVGDPLADLGYLLSMYPRPSSRSPRHPPLSPVTAGAGSQPRRAGAAVRGAAPAGRAPAGTSASRTGRPPCSSRPCGSATWRRPRRRVRAGHGAGRAAEAGAAGGRRPRRRGRRPLWACRR